MTTNPLPPVETIAAPIVQAFATIAREADARTTNIGMLLEAGDPAGAIEAVQYVAWLRNIGDLVATMAARCVVSGRDVTASSARSLIDAIGQLDEVMQAKHARRLDRMSAPSDLSAIIGEIAAVQEATERKLAEMRT
jgi:hypothetical protein